MGRPEWFDGTEASLLAHGYVSMHCDQPGDDGSAEWRHCRLDAAFKERVLRERVAEAPTQTHPA